MSLLSAINPTVAMGTASGLSGIYAANKSASSAKRANKLNAMMSLLLQANEEKFEKWKLANSYQETIKDMQKAGINPILGATKNGPTSAGSIPESFAGAQVPDTSGYAKAGEGITSAIQNNVVNTQNQTHLNNEAITSTAQASKDVATATKISKEAGILDKYGEKEAEARINNLNQTTAKLNQETEQILENRPYILNQNFGKASQELYQGRLSDVSADFLNEWGVTRDEAFKIGKVGIDFIKELADSGLSKSMIKLIMGDKKIINMLENGKRPSIQDLKRAFNIN